MPRSRSWGGTRRWPASPAQSPLVAPPSAAPAAPPPAAGAGRSAALDGLRALAVLLVIPHNAGLPVEASTLLEAAVRHAYAAGWVGVQLFFVLSGFLITRILRESRARPGYFPRFYARRALRILPAYYLLLFVCLAVVPQWLVMPRDFAPTAGSVSAFALFYINWVGTAGDAVPGLGHLWSLAVEEQFYLAWPAVVLVLDRRALLRLVAVLVLASPLIRMAMLASGMPSGFVYEATPARMDALLCGAAVALWLEDAAAVQRARHLVAPALVASALAVLALVPATHGFERHHGVTQVAGFSVLSVAFSTLLAAVVVADGTRWPVRWLGTPVLRSIGFFSYGMYLVHQPLNQWWAEGAFRRWWGNGADGYLPFAIYSALLVAGSYALARILWAMVERPVLALRERWWPAARGS